MGTELVKVSEVITPAVIVEQPTLPVLVERAHSSASRGVLHIPAKRYSKQKTGIASQRFGPSQNLGFLHRQPA
jgi:hypothetical protein